MAASANTRDGSRQHDDAGALDEMRPAYAPGTRFHRENILMLQAYADRLLETLSREGKRSVLSLGIGHGPVATSLMRALGSLLDHYCIIEGSARAIEDLRSSGPLPAGMRVIHGLFEEFSCSERFDAVEMGFVLEHVEDAPALIARHRELLRPEGILFVAVPNALSLHRRIGMAAGLLADPYELSQDDRALGHRRIFDLESVTDLVEAAGLTIVRREGLLLKPLTTEQLARLSLPGEVWRALAEVARPYPELASAVYLEARRSSHDDRS